jgi:hypothetical protein
MLPEEIANLPELLPVAQAQFNKMPLGQSLHWYFLHRRGSLGVEDGAVASEKLQLQTIQPNTYVCFGAFRDLSRRGFIGAVLDLPYKRVFAKLSPAPRREFLLRAAKLWYDTLLNPKTCPWPGMAEMTVPTYDAEGDLSSVTLTNMAVPADLLINYMIALRTPYYQHGSDHFLFTFGVLTNRGITPRDAWFLMSTMKMQVDRTIDWSNFEPQDEDPFVLFHPAAHDYFLTNTLVDPAAFFTSKPAPSDKLLSHGGKGIPNNLIWNFKKKMLEEELLTNRGSSYSLTTEGTKAISRTMTQKVFGTEKIVPNRASPMKIIPLLLRRARQIAVRNPHPVQFNQLGEVL